MNNGDFTRRVEFICEIWNEDLAELLEHCGLSWDQWQSWRVLGGVRRSDAERIANWLAIPVDYLTDRYPADFINTWTAFIDHLRLRRAASPEDVRRIFTKKAGELAGAKLRGRKFGVTIGPAVFDALIEGEKLSRPSYDPRDEILPDEKGVNWNDPSLF